MVVMSHPRVVNIRVSKVGCVYIGRVSGSDFHWGNPFGRRGNLVAVRVSSREEAVSCFRRWLVGSAFLDVEQGRRQWIIDHIGELRGKVLGCFCAPAACHGDVLARLADLVDEV